MIDLNDDSHLYKKPYVPETFADAKVAIKSLQYKCEADGTFAEIGRAFVFGVLPLALLFGIGLLVKLSRAQSSADVADQSSSYPTDANAPRVPGRIEEEPAHSKPNHLQRIEFNFRFDFAPVVRLFGFVPFSYFVAYSDFVGMREVVREEPQVGQCDQDKAKRKYLPGSAHILVGRRVGWAYQLPWKNGDGQHQTESCKAQLNDFTRLGGAANCGGYGGEGDCKHERRNRPNRIVNKRRHGLPLWNRGDSLGSRDDIGVAVAVH